LNLLLNQAVAAYLEALAWLGKDYRGNLISDDDDDEKLKTTMKISNLVPSGLVGKLLVNKLPEGG
jgi:hypothetical protein